MLGGNAIVAKSRKLRNHGANTGGVPKPDRIASDYPSDHDLLGTLWECASGKWCRDASFLAR